MTTLFDDDDNPPVPSAPISLSREALPSKGETQAVPLHATPLPPELDVCLEPFWAGCRLLGVRSVGSQQVEIARLLLAEVGGVPLHPEVVIEEPRRAAKTTSIWSVLLGLCATRKGFLVVVTAQTYVKARERFLDVYRTISRRNVGDFIVKRGAAEMAIEWTNGSRLWVVTPEGGAFRGDGADRIFFDEAQEHDREKTEDLLGGALALMDTRFSDDADLTDDDAKTNGQLIVSGTAGEGRSGMLWDFLERGRADQIAIIEYAVPEGTPVALDAQSEEGRAGIEAGWQVSTSGKLVLNEPALRAAHPGIGTLTTMGTVRNRFTALTLAAFQREYGGQWPIDVNARAIDPGLWKHGLVTTPPPKPQHFTLGYDVAPDQSVAALVAAWRDEQGRPWLEVIRHEQGDAWLPKAIHKVTSSSQSTRVGYDKIGPNQSIADTLERTARPKPRLYALGTADIVAGASTLMAELQSGRLRHVEDVALDTAADVATRRSIGDGSWAWGRRKSGDISTLVAGTNALKLYDADRRTHTAAVTATRIYSLDDFQ